MRDSADVRLHGTTGERPIDRFTRIEAASLQPLEGRPPIGAKLSILANNVAFQPNL
jgi:hypothetical protein